MEPDSIARLTAAMAAYDAGDARRILHFLHVHAEAAAIGRIEGLDAETQQVLEAAALLHDIGIHKAEQLYGSTDGKLQERLGPPEARQLLAWVGGFSEQETERICFLIAHHHTYDNIDAPDYQILVEADLLVNFREDGVSAAAALQVGERIFRTETGKRLLRERYLCEEPTDPNE